MLGSRWAWVRSLESPSDVSTEHLLLVYRLNRPRCKLGECRSNCKSSPFCLNGLNQIELPVLEKSSDLKNSDEPESSLTPFKSNNVVNGLKNYGSTCYLNAFLQLYFRLDELRQAIFSLPIECDETGIIYQLQLIFSQLELLKSGVVDPGGLIQCLRLCQEEQQDAPEFHCLFMHLLESHFQQCGLAVVDDLLRGEYVYETRCLNCGFTSRQPSHFLELPLKFSSNSLPGCIRNYMKEESLTGENQYACSKCQTKHDGVRRVFITRAPRLLCIQLLRFTYDPRTEQRKKQKASIRIPDRLQLVDMLDSKNASGPYSGAAVACLASSSDTATQLSYKLCGVLLHIGAQPTSGHYVAVVREPANQPRGPDCTEADSWTVCNDTEVYTIPASQFCLSKVTTNSKGWQLVNNVEQGKGDPENSDGPLSKKPRPDDQTTPSEESQQVDTNSVSDTTVWHSSSSAYMLFYRVIDDVQPQPDVQIPENLRHIVEAMNLEQDEQILARQALQRKKMMCLQNLYTTLHLPEPNDDNVTLDELALVPTQWLRSWFEQPDQPPPPIMLPADGSSTAKPSPFFKPCLHGRVPIDMDSSDYRAVSFSGLRSALEQTDVISIPFRLFEPCLECTRLKVALIQLEQRIRMLSKEMDNFIHSKETAFERSADDSEKSTEPTFFWIGKRSLRKWRNLCRKYVAELYTDPENTSHTPPQTTFNTDILCPHKQLRNNSRRIRLMPAQLWHKLISLLPGANIPIFPVTSDKMCGVHCPQCEKFESSLAERASTERDSMPRLLSQNFNVMPKLFGDNWQPTNVELNMSEEKRSAPQSTSIDPHTSLTTSNSPPTNSSESPQPSIPSEIDNLDNPNLIHLIPLDFVLQWRKFARNPLPETLPDRLESVLNVDGVLCDHGQLTMPWQDLIRESIACPVTASEYRVLWERYGGSPEFEGDTSILNGSDEEAEASEIYPPLFLVPSTDEGGAWQLRPQSYSRVCSECYAQFLAERSHFNNAQLRVRLVRDPAALLETMSQNVQCTSSNGVDATDELQADQLAFHSSSERNCATIAEQSTSKSPRRTVSNSRSRHRAPVVEGSVRRSRRQRLCPDDLLIPASSDTLLQDFKVQIMNSLGVTPADQHLVLNGVELSEPKKTLSELGVHIDSLFYLWTDAQPWEAGEGAVRKLIGNGKTKENGLDKNNSAARPCKEPVEVGFKGTRLLNN